MRKKFFIIFMLSCMMALTGCGHTAQETATPAGKIKVVTSFEAMQAITEAIGKDHVDVQTIIPNGTEPHNFEPTTRNLITLQNAKVFIYNGFDLEKAWLDKALSTVSDNKDLLVIEASKGAQPLPLAESNGKKNAVDPHIWLSISGAQQEAENIKEALIKADPANKDDYEKNCEAFKTSLEQLKTDYTAKFASAPRKDFVTGHAAFSYLARDFNLEQKSVSDALLSGEPSAKNLKELTDYCKENNVTTIFVEDMVSPKVSQTLANEVDAKAVEIYTLESLPEGMDYVEALKADLDKIYASLN